MTLPPEIRRSIKFLDRHDHSSMLKDYRKAGFSVVGCNHPFLGDETDYRVIAKHCARAVQLIRSKSGWERMLVPGYRRFYL